MLFPRKIIDLISFCAFKADMRSRKELSKGWISRENDYTSNFIGMFRRNVEDLDVQGLDAKIAVLGQGDEQAFGADACVILKNKTHCKVAIFEAKWPRLSFPNYRWDSLQGKTKKSHFSSQIIRQRPFFPKVAIWEMFYCEFPITLQPSYMPPSGSACIWHDDAYNFVLNRGLKSLPWSSAELTGLLQQQQKPLTISDVISTICECSQGEIMPIGEELNAFGDEPLPRVALIISFDSDESLSEYPIAFLGD